MKHLIPILCLFVSGIVFCDTIYLKNNQFIDDVQYIGYNDTKLIFKTNNLNKYYFILLSESEKITDNNGIALDYKSDEYFYKWSEPGEIWLDYFKNINRIISLLEKKYNTLEKKNKSLKPNKEYEALLVEIDHLKNKLNDEKSEISNFDSELETKDYELELNAKETEKIERSDNSSYYEDILYLKDGSVIYGIIIEIKPNEYYKIQSGKNIFVYQIDEIDFIKKEMINKEVNYVKDFKDKNGVIGIGIPFSNLSKSLICISGNFKVSEHSTFSVYLGFPGAYGFSYDYHQNYNDNGFRLSIAIGQFYYDGWYDDDEWFDQYTLTFAYQLKSAKAKKNKQNNFWVLGVGLQRYENADYDYYNDWYYDEPKYYTVFYPTFSWEHHF